MSFATQPNFRINSVHSHEVVIPFVNTFKINFPSSFLVFSYNVAAKFPWPQIDNM